MPKASAKDSRGSKASAPTTAGASHQRDHNITAAPKSPHADDKPSIELSLDELLSKNEDLSDPNTRALLTAMGVYTTADLTNKTLPDLVQGGFTVVSARKVMQVVSMANDKSSDDNTKPLTSNFGTSRQVSSDSATSRKKKVPQRTTSLPPPTNSGTNSGSPTMPAGSQRAGPLLSTQNSMLDGSGSLTSSGRIGTSLDRPSNNANANQKGGGSVTNASTTHPQSSPHLEAMHQALTAAAANRPDDYGNSSVGGKSSLPAVGRRPMRHHSSNDALQGAGGVGGIDTASRSRPLPPVSEQPSSHLRVSSESSVLAPPPPPPSMPQTTASTARALLGEAQELASCEKLGEAAAVCERAVAMLTSSSPDRLDSDDNTQPPEAMQAINLLSNICLRRGRLDDACHHTTWLLKLKKRTMGEEDVSTADTMLVQGQILKRQGKVDDAVVYLRWALKIREASLGENHLKTALALLALGNCFMHQASQQSDKLHDARASFLRCLKIRRSHFGIEHLEVAAALHNIAVVLFCQRRYQACVDAHAAAMEMRVRCVGFDSSAVGDSLFSLGCVARDLEEWQVAHEYFREASSVSMKAFGEQHANTKASREEEHSAASKANIRNSVNDDDNEEEEVKQSMTSKSKVTSFSTKEPDRAIVGNDYSRSTLYDTATSPRSSFRKETPVGPQIGKRNSAAAAKRAKKGEQADTRDKTPRTIAPPQRRRPEAVRSSWDDEEDEAGGVLAENPDEEDTEQDIMALLAEVDVVDSYGLKSTDSHSMLPGVGGPLHSANSDRQFVAPSQQGGRRSGADRAATGAASTATATNGAPCNTIRSAMKRNVPLVAFPSVSEVVERATQGNNSSDSSTGPKTRSRVLSNHHVGLSAGAMKYSSEMLRNRFGQNLALLSGDDGFDDSLLAC